MSWWSAPSGATRARARSSTGCRSRADVIVRFQGGHNAGHTLVIGGKVFKLALLPSGIVRPGKLSVIGNGVVLDPYHLVSEIETCRAQGVEVTPDNLKIAENVPLILSLLSRARRASRIGRGGGVEHRHHQARHRPGLRGQGRPARDPADGPGRAGIARRQDRPPARPSRRRCGAGMGLTPPSRGGRFERNCSTSRRKVLPYMAPTFELLDRERRAGKRILFEGAQGALLDVDHGTYPYVTSSNTVAGQRGDRLRPRAGRDRLRARHRQGLHDAGRRRPVPDRARRRDRRADRQARQRIRHQHRPAAPLRLVRRGADAADACATSGIDGIALTKLDMLDGFDEIKVCDALSARRQGDRLPAGLPGGTGAARAGLRDDRRLARGHERRRSWADLPAQAIKYVRRIEELIGAPVALLSTSPERDDTILVHDPFQD